jgi:hypothetical protein
MTLVILGILAVTWTILSKLYDNKHYRNSNLMATLTIIGLIVMIPIIITAIPVILAIGLGVLLITLLAGVIGFAVYGFIAYLTRR